MWVSLTDEDVQGKGGGLFSTCVLIVGIVWVFSPHKVVTKKASPAPSQSLLDKIGVWTYWKSWLVRKNY